MPLRVATVEDDERYRASLELLLSQSSEVEFGGGYPSAGSLLATLEAALASGREPGWDLILMDLDLPGISGIEGIRRVKALAPNLPVVVLSVSEDRATILQAICAGADGYLVKWIPGSVLLSELSAVLAGGSPLSAGVARTVLDLVRLLPPLQIPPEGGFPDTPGLGGGDGALTDRELEVLRCLVQGMSYKRVGHTLGIRKDTVRSHIRNIYRKLQVHSVAEAVRMALWEGLV